ncbi:MAG: bifunctional acetate--CoA ligase family protein/GNAT family N-acetyltransferase [Alphaproteobacteria bacterium]|nr:bifunctional acetate--CoA ligase family protein/GNAT family N-acetyltransferase [Alphaproteobacteria bacterium]
MTIRNLNYLLAPRSIALIGASDRDRSVGRVLTDNLLSGGFEGPVWPVNPKADTIAGVKAYRRISELPDAPDLGVIAIPPKHVPDAIAELADRGARAAVVISAGLDRGDRQRMLDAGRPVTMRIQGPNCLGLMLPRIGLNASFSHIAPAKGDIAFLSQSGALILAVVDWAAGRGIGFSHVVSLGDMADVDFGDMLDYLAADNQSRAILLYIENITHAAKFMSAARRAARVKPVVAIKAGRHEAAARAAFSHTGSLAGADHAYETALRRAGVVRVKTLQDLFDAAEVLTRLPPLQGERLTIVTNGGGAGILATDRLADLGGQLADLSDATLDALNRALPATWSKTNPIDIIGDAGPERYAATLDAILEDPDTECILALNCPTALASSTAIAEQVIQTYRSTQTSQRIPLLTNWLGEAASREARARFSEENIPTFETPADAVNAHGILVAHRKAQMELLRTPPSDGTQVTREEIARADQILDGALARGARTLSELESKRLLDCYGIPIVPTEYAASPEAARRLGEQYLKSFGACVVKIAAEGITHKSDVGGVHLNLTTAESVEAAARDILDRLGGEPSGPAETGVVVQPMIRRPNAIELLVGTSVDDTFGPLITFGAGGTAVEVLRDTATGLPPLDPLLAREMIGRTRVAKLLAGYRDRPTADIDAVTDTLLRLGDLVARHPAIRELDINPLLADAQGVIALDARVQLLDPKEFPRQAMAIRPYPIEWESEVEIGTLGKVIIRPIKPVDEKRLEKFFDRISADDLRMRFFTARRHVSHQSLVRLTQIDYAREMTFLAVAGDSGDFLGSVRVIVDPDYEQAEFGIIVRSDLKGQGIGWRLMQQMIRYARHEGIGKLYGAILRENTTMLKMCDELGFTRSTAASDPLMVEVEFPVGAD